MFWGVCDSLKDSSFTLKGASVDFLAEAHGSCVVERESENSGLGVVASAVSSQKEFLI